MTGGRSPWGKPGSGGNSGGGSGDDGGEKPPSGDDAPRGPRNPWLPGGGGGEDRPRRSASIEDIFKNRGPEGPRRSGGGPGGPNFRMPRRAGGGSWLPLAIGAVVGIGLLVSMVHQVGAKEQGLVTTAGKYSSTLPPGLHMTGPWPIQSVQIADVTSIRSVAIPDGNEERLILTSDQNLVDLSYRVRWNIKDLAQFQFQLADPVETISEVAEAAMRAAVAEHKLDQVISGAGRAQIEERVRVRTQQVLDAYRAGVIIQGVDIAKADPPARVVEAFKDVSAAQQDADAEANKAEAYAQQVLARAQGDAAAFDRIYAEYRLAPEVTRRRMYYETMESVLGKTDKTIVETGNVTPYLPLPEIQRRTQQQAQPAAPAQGGQ